MTLSLASPNIMGILNVTPDSFSDGGRFNTLERAIEQALKMVDDGAAIIDVGGESTRPGAMPVSIEQECERVIPVIESLKNKISVPISIDTRHAIVMKMAIEAGASMVNDVWALQDEGALAVVCATQVPVCLMHMQGAPQTMQKSPVYSNVLEEVYQFLENRIAICEQNGILRKNIWIDPGFGFGKTLEHNLTLLGNLSYFKTLGCKMLIGLSRKKMFGEILNKTEEHRLYGSIAGAILAVQQGADVIRTHDVAQTKDALAVVDAIGPYCSAKRSAKNLG